MFPIEIAFRNVERKYELGKNGVETIVINRKEEQINICYEKDSYLRYLRIPFKFS